MAKSALRLVPPTQEIRTVVPVRRKNAELRTREHLTAGEVDVLIDAAKGNRWDHRDATMILVAYRHGLRAAELCDLRWDQDSKRFHFDSIQTHFRARRRPSRCGARLRPRNPGGATSPDRLPQSVAASCAGPDQGM
jgi:integrase